MDNVRGSVNENPSYDCPSVSLDSPEERRASAFSAVKTPLADQAESVSLGLLLSDITSLILLSLSTEKFLAKTQNVHQSAMYSSKTSRRETFQLLEAAGSTIDVLYELMEREQSTASRTISQDTSPSSQCDSTLIKGSSMETVKMRSVGNTTTVAETKRGGHVERATSTNDLDKSISSRSGEYLSCESEISKSMEEYRSCEQLIPSLKKHEQDSFSIENKDGRSGNHLRRNSSSHSLSYLDRRSTTDSGIASPQFLCTSTQGDEPNRSKDDSCLDDTPQHRMEQDVVSRVQKLKITVDQKLRDSLANLSNWYSEDDGTSSLREHVKAMKIRYEKATTDEWESGAMHDVIMDKALATSVLAMENAQLGNEVNALRHELQATYEQAKGRELKGLFVSRLSENLQEMKRRHGESDSDDTSSSEISTPDTQLLNTSYARRNHHHHSTGILTTPTNGKELPAPSSSGKRRLKVPQDLKSHSYRSISRSSTSASSSSGSSHLDSTDGTGCCDGLFGCFSRRSKRRGELLEDA